MTVEAIQLTKETSEEILSWIGVSRFIIDQGEIEIMIPTFRGPMPAKEGDYIIKVTRAFFYACPAGLFEKTYEEGDE